MKKGLKLLSIFVVFMMIFSTSFAGEMIDFTVDPDICRFSDYQDSKNNLPYVRVSEGNIAVDTEVEKSGICISNSEISVTENMSKVQILTSPYEIKVNGNIEHAILLSEKIVINGKITGTVLALANTIELGENSSIDGEIILLGSSLKCSGTINGNVIGESLRTSVSNTANIVGGLRLITDNIELDEAAKVTGKVYVKSINDFDIPNDLRDYIQFVKIENNRENDSASTLPIMKIVISSMVVALIYVLISNKSNVFKNMNKKLDKKFVILIISGLAFIFLVPLIVLLAILISIAGLAVVGVPVLIITLAVIFLAIAIRIPVVTASICEYMLSTKYAANFNTMLKKFILASIVGITLHLLGYIPVVGSYITYFFVVVAIGIMIMFTILRKMLNKGE